MREGALLILMGWSWLMLKSGLEPVRLLGVAVTIGLLALAWVSRGRLKFMGLEYVNWNRTSHQEVLRGAALGVGAGLVVAWWFRAMPHGTEPPWSQVWLAVTLGPLIEEAVFRGYLFRFLQWSLARRLSNPVWVAAVAIAVAFAVAHMMKPGITPSQVAVIFLMGILYGWLRLKSGSTVPAFVAHAAYNALVFAAAGLLD